MSLYFRFILFLSFAVILSAESGPGVVSVEELRNPLTGKSLRAILAAEEQLRSGRRELAMQDLRRLMTDQAAMPYALSMLGVEHLRDGQVDVALNELEQAVRLLPGRPENHSNFAFALFLKGQTERGLRQARRALQLDAGRPKTRLVLALLLLQQGSHDAEAVQQLRLAAEEDPDAHLVLAQHYDRVGQKPEAEKERRAYTVGSMSLLATQ